MCIGISMGGMIAQELAIARGDLLATLTIGCSYCGGPGSDLGDFAALQPLFEALQAGDFDRAVRAAWEANIAPPLVDDDAAFAEFVRVGASRAIPPATVIAQLAACRGHDTQRSAWFGGHADAGAARNRRPDLRAAER